jgi:hypothetical protein
VILETDSNERVFKSSGEGFLQFYSRLFGEMQEKLQPSLRYKLDKKQNPTVSINTNLQLLQEAHNVLEDEWENLFYVYRLIKTTGNHNLTLEMRK